MKSYIVIEITLTFDDADLPNDARENCKNSDDMAALEFGFLEQGVHDILDLIDDDSQVIIKLPHEGYIIQL